MKRTVVLAVLDGWGVGTRDASNPIHAAELPTIARFEREFPRGTLQASGLAVGLPWDEEGNSEVGHLTIGAGQVLLQHFPRISQAIESGAFYENETLRAACGHAVETGGAVHLVGLLSSGNVHASFEHVRALVELVRREQVHSCYLHVFLDGRDSPPKSAGPLLAELEQALAESGVGKIATVAGRYWGMDRDQHWERTERAYRAIVLGTGGRSPSTEQCIETQYAAGVTDEFIPPTVVGDPHPLESGDAVICWNFREDRMRQLVQALADPTFAEFPRETPPNLSLATMTAYLPARPTEPSGRAEQAGLPDLAVPAAFPTAHPTQPLGKVLADADRVQLRVAETEKYAHVTYFFNGLIEPAFPGEYRVLIPSPRVARYDETPEMSAGPLTDRVLLALNEGTYDFILVNYANADMVAHTGNFDATVLAVTVVDRELARLAAAVLAGTHALLITSDHGNAEVLFDPVTGSSETKHNRSPVPVYLVGAEFQHSPTPEPRDLAPCGMLSDVAPTVLELLGIKKPPEMTGQSLLAELVRTARG
ncbi:MAG: 2,3-bisphosphoglycerate-independent phosphoglycerate mutase [bacterium]|nr:2,3-bisphosphoglycerate-independent phosphoglycerate mutase [bacterium]